MIASPCCPLVPLLALSEEGETVSRRAEERGVGEVGHKKLRSYVAKRTNLMSSIFFVFPVNAALYVCWGYLGSTRQNHLVTAVASWCANCFTISKGREQGGKHHQPKTVCVCVPLFVCLFVCLFICVFVCLCVCLFACWGLV